MLHTTSNIAWCWLCNWQWHWEDVLHSESIHKALRCCNIYSGLHKWLINWVILQLCNTNNWQECFITFFRPASKILKSPVSLQDLGNHTVDVNKNYKWIWSVVSQEYGKQPIHLDLIKYLQKLSQWQRNNKVWLKMIRT